MARRTRTDWIIGKDVSLWVAQRHAQNFGQVRRIRRAPLVMAVTGSALLFAAAYAYLSYAGLLVQ
jgi:hypothetical protein